MENWLKTDVYLLDEPGVDINVRSSYARNTSATVPKLATQAISQQLLEHFLQWMQ